MDQSCLGAPRTLDSEITITVDEEGEDVDPTAQLAATDDQFEDKLELTERDAASIHIEEIREVQPS